MRTRQDGDILRLSNYDMLPWELIWRQLRLIPNNFRTSVQLCELRSHDIEKDNQEIRGEPALEGSGFHKHHQDFSGSADSGGNPSEVWVGVGI